MRLHDRAHGRANARPAHDENISPRPVPGSAEERLLDQERRDRWRPLVRAIRARDGHGRLGRKLRLHDREGRRRRMIIGASGRLEVRRLGRRLHRDGAAGGRLQPRIARWCALAHVAVCPVAAASRPDDAIDATCIERPRRPEPDEQDQRHDQRGARRSVCSPMTHGGQHAARDVPLQRGSRWTDRACLARLAEVGGMSLLHLAAHEENSTVFVDARARWSGRHGARAVLCVPATGAPARRRALHRNLARRGGCRGTCAVGVAPACVSGSSAASCSRRGC